MRSLPVGSITETTPTTRLLQLDTGDDGFPFEPGQAALIGVHDQPVRKPYSVASAPSDTARQGIEFLIRADPDGGLGSHLAGVNRGTLVEVGAPFGSLGYADARRQGAILFIAGGTGIAPIRSIIRQLVAEKSAAQLALVYSARIADDFPFRRELERLSADGLLRLALTATRDAPTAWPGHRGRLDESLLTRMLRGEPETLVVVCGPPSMVGEVPRLLERIGVPSRFVRVQQT